VCFRQRGQNFESSIRSGSFFRFFVVEYVRDRQVEHASVMIGRLSFGIATLPAQSRAARETRSRLCEFAPRG
jgi:hypothetical protein